MFLNVRGVFHYNISRSPQAYLQEIGRAGRDGNPSRCTLAASPSDRNILRNFVLARAPHRANFDACLKAIAGRAGTSIAGAYDISTTYNVADSFVDLLLAYLEMQEVLGETTTFVVPRDCRAPDPTWLAALPPRKRSDVEAFLRLGKLKRSRTHFASETPGEQESWRPGAWQRRLRDLDGYAELDLNLKTLHILEVRRPPTGTEAEAVWVAFQSRIRADLEKIEQMWSLVQSRECLWVHLARLMGEPTATACGTCSVCQGRPTSTIEVVNAPLEAAAVVAASWMLAHPELRHRMPHDLASFLVGVLTPEGKRMRAYDKEGFASLRERPFEQVVEACARHHAALAARAEELTQAKAAKLEQAKAAKRQPPPTNVDERLFDALRAKRRELANARNIAPYMVFPDLTLRHMASSRPSSVQEIATVPGVGPVKLRDYGQVFLEVCQAHSMREDQDSSGAKR